MKIVKYLAIFFVAASAIFLAYKSIYPENNFEPWPFVKGDSNKFYYIRYEAKDSHDRKFGMAYFIYPIFLDKREFSKLEYDPPLYDFADLLKGDGNGDKGSFKVKSGVLFSDILPFSVPIPKNGWRMIYGGNEYSCNETPAPADYEFASCVLGKTTLSYRFKSDVGVDQYDDFCGKEVCRFRLKDELGIFSDLHLRYVGLLDQEGSESRKAR
jgi:hypothetical protein